MKIKTNLVIITFTVIFILFAAGCDEDKADSSTDSTVTSVTISPATASVAKGSTKDFTATVTGTDKPKQTVTWSIVETNKNSGTTINTSGKLTVAAAETLSKLTVKATSTEDKTKSGTATVTVTAAGSGSGASFNGVTWTNADLNSGWQKTAQNGPYDVEMWNEKKQGTASMTLGVDGTYKCSWDGINNVLFRAGRKYNKTQTHSQIGVFSIEYEAPVFNPGTTSGSSNAYLSVYGWVSGGSSDTLIEYYIIEAKGEFDPGTAKEATQVGPSGGVTIDGGTYKLYTVPKTNAPSIEGDKNFVQYFSIRTSNRTGGTISVSEHFKAWNSAGLTSINDGKLYEVALKVESYGGTAGKSKGNAEITKNILSVNSVPIK